MIHNKILLPIMLALTLIAGCARNKAIEQQAMESAEPADGNSFVTLDGYEPTAISAENHQRHLADPMIFASIPDQAVTDSKTAVVGSRVCLFYPLAKPAALADLAKLPEGIAVPFGTILPMTGERLNCADGNNYGTGMFQFQDNWNWFYPTIWNGTAGVVFGADLTGLNDTAENNRITAQLYNTAGSYPEFYPILGYQPLPEAVQQRISAERVAIQAVDESEYNLWASQPDDMLALYLKHRAYDNTTNPVSRKVPVFITTDLLSHSRHLIFDRTLQYLEEDQFTPRLKALCDAFIQKLQDPKTVRTLTGPVALETHKKAILYFQVASALLELAPERAMENDPWGRPTIVYKDRDANSILMNYPAEVRAEIALMDKAEGLTISPVFTFANGAKAVEDYSQYRPRGHYTKNGVLSSYFRAMMWFGRMHFLIAEGGDTPLSLADGQSASDSLTLTLAMQPVALLLTDLVRADNALYRQWADLYDPITTLIGLSDDLSFQELLPLWKSFQVTDFNDWVADKTNLLGLMRAANDQLRPPAISGNSVFWGPSVGEERAPLMGWRLFGQRFTWDSWVHHRVSPPRLMSRDMVRGLDIMKAFGSHTAEALLLQSDYPVMEGLKERLDGIEQAFAGRDNAFWNANYYTQVLREIGALARFEPGSGFYFTEGSGWGLKAMLSAHGTWAELRHDTLLYVKQSAAERAGDGDFAPTFRTEPIPEPVHYIEPNLAYWQAARAATNTLLTTLEQYKMLDDETSRALVGLRTLLTRILSIVEQEVRNEYVPAEDIRWIPTIPAELVHMILVHTGRGDMMEEDQMRMALIADVFTNVELGLVLETAVGIPYRVYVPLNDLQGGKRIAVGYCFSYFEFPQTMSNRLTNEEWKSTVYAKDANLYAYMPFWSKGRILPSEARK